MNVVLAQASDGPSATLVLNLIGNDEEGADRARSIGLVMRERRRLVASSMLLGQKNIVVAEKYGDDTFRLEFVQSLGETVDPAVQVCLNSSRCAIQALEDAGALHDLFRVNLLLGREHFSLERHGDVWRATYELPPRETITTYVDGFFVSLQLRPLPYLFAAVDPAAGEHYEERLETVRHALAATSGLAVSPSTPKIGLVAPGDAGAHLVLRTRTDTGGGWHPRAAASGLLALGVALATPGTVPWTINREPHTTAMWVKTPAGLRPLWFDTDALGTSRVEIELSDVAVLATAEVRR